VEGTAPSYPAAAARPLNSSREVEENLTDSRLTYGRPEALSGTADHRGSFAGWGSACSLRCTIGIDLSQPAERTIRLGFGAMLSTSPRQKAMEEKRRHPRTEIDEAAYISSGGSVMSCVVRNISAAGAAIDVDNPAFVPQRFRLVMAKDSSVRDCRMIWIQGNRIGLAFIDGQGASEGRQQA
jgi:hypothetical protein